MKISLAAILLFLLFSSEKCKNKDLVSVQLKITETETYCGGAAPPDELIQDLQTPKPLSSRKLYLFKDDILVDSILGDNSDTTYQIQLISGNYNLRQSNSLINGIAKNEVQKCMNEWLSRKMQSFEIKGDTSLTIHVHFDCNPCYPPPP
ncbi:MAG: hypothetical protein H6607_11660 [Flavobacteriales bacterium]|nr:hypothetical protein [Flavobacteriales bacterium]